MCIRDRYDAGALVPLDDYIEKYPNIKNLFTELEWEKLRQDDGHIYWIPPVSYTHLDVYKRQGICGRRVSFYG